MPRNWSPIFPGEKHQFINYYSNLLTNKSLVIKPATLLPKFSTDEDYSCKELNKLAAILENDSWAGSFINCNGTLAVLPTDSFTSFARHVASYEIIELKRFSINQVYQLTNDARFSGQPPEPINTELALDIVSTPSSTGKALRQADAEIIKIFDQVLNKDCQLSCVVLQLSHRLLIEAILIYFKVPLGMRSKACRRLQKELKCRNKGASELLKIIMKILIFVKGSLNDVRSQLRGLPDWIGSEADSLAEKAFGELKEIINFLSSPANTGQDDCLSCQIFLSLSFGLEYYDTHSGFLFNFIHEWSNLKQYMVV